MEKLHGVVHYHDPLNNIEYDGTDSVTYLISYHHDWISNFDFTPYSVIVDPWRTGMIVPFCSVINL